MTKKTKKQLNQEFLEKIKTIFIGTGTSDSPSQTIDLSQAKCINCGEKLEKHDLGKIGLIAIGGTMRPPKPKPENPETSFAV